MAKNEAKTEMGRQGAVRGPEDADVALGNAIRLRRRQIGMSQGALAEACQVSFQQVQKYESGANRVSFSRLLQIARALDCTASELIAALDVDQPGVAGLGGLLPLVRAPGAADLLTAYAAMPAETQTALIALARAIGKGTQRPRSR